MDARSNRDAIDDADRMSSPSAAAPRSPTRRAREDAHRARHRDEQSSHRRKPYRDSPSSGEDSFRQRRRDDGRDDREAQHSNYRSEKYHRDRRGTRASVAMDSPARDRSRDQQSRHRNRSPARRRSRSPQRRKNRRSHSRSRSPPRRSQASLPSQDESFRRETGAALSTDNPTEKQKPNFKPTGLLAKEANTVAGTTTVLKYHEPPEARKPPAKEQWRMYVFKKKDLLDTVYLHQRSCWLLGRDQKVTDLFLEHPSISKQHAVIQFRHITSTNEYGDKSSRVKPYLIDLESSNGTHLNGKKMEASRFVELVDADVIAFGDSDREYVVMLPPAG